MKYYFTLVSLFCVVVGWAQQRDSRVREYLSPVKILWQSCDIPGINNLLQQGNGQSELAIGDLCILKSTEKEQASVLLDFGREIQGGIQFVTGMSPSHQPVAVRVRFGESASEAMCDIDGHNGASNDHAMRDFTLQLPWLGVAEAGNSGFRFARIDLLDKSAELYLKEIRAISIYRDLEYKGSFSCNDERLNEIWKTGAYTVQLNMQEYLWDGIKRDRLVWVGDLHPEVMTVSCVFGYNEVVPKSLDLIRDITPLPQWMNGISSYSLWWLLIQRDWYKYQGDFNYLKAQQKYLTGLLELLLTKINEKGVEQLDGFRFLDWPSSENAEAIHAGLQSLMVQAFDAGVELCSILDEEALAARCKSAAQLSRKAGQYLNPAGTKQAAALMAISGLMVPGKVNDMYISAGGAKGFSTFYGYYMLRAMALAGNYKGALDIIRTYWGAMLDLGATTFWEDFDMDWLPDAARIDSLVPVGKKDIHRDYGKFCYQGYRHSFCHGWASGPTAWLSEFILGVHVVEPGCRVVRIIPELGDLQWVEGTFPTPHGVIKIRHERDANGKVKSSIDAPEEIVIIKE
ncbi:alpha-L-rhamnosidase-related protein [Parabacteroides provencensis]|uniref:alpha-L-rhamnosidase-related protein n=1 Tax=Parabacteroides provencensis TaxID=1944636 RepID=UPI000C14612E|nr:alpha-L-rhamnosidase C-terminal domain-containing protein [Parabacteroides provencensis]